MGDMPIEAPLSGAAGAGNKRMNKRATPVWVRAAHDSSLVSSVGDVAVQDLLASNQRAFAARFAANTSASSGDVSGDLDMEGLFSHDSSIGSSPGKAGGNDKPKKSKRGSKKAAGGGRWTKEEDDKLRVCIQDIGVRDFGRIAERMGNGRTEAQCHHRWRKVLEPGLVKGPWTKHEDEMIRKCIDEGVMKWSEIAERIPGRIGKQCRERWFNHLDPSLKKGGWAEAEDALLVEAQAKWGNSWTKIARLLPGRSENAVKNRWNSATRRRAKQGQSGAGPHVGVAARAKAAIVVNAAEENGLLDDLNISIHPGMIRAKQLAEEAKKRGEPYVDPFEEAKKEANSGPATSSSADSSLLLSDGSSRAMSSSMYSSSPEQDLASPPAPPPRKSSKASSKASKKSLGENNLPRQTTASAVVNAVRKQADASQHEAMPPRPGSPPLSLANDMGSTGDFFRNDEIAPRFSPTRTQLASLGAAGIGKSSSTGAGAMTIPSSKGGSKMGNGASASASAAASAAASVAASAAASSSASSSNNYLKSTTTAINNNTAGSNSSKKKKSKSRSGKGKAEKKSAKATKEETKSGASAAPQPQQQDGMDMERVFGPAFHHLSEREKELIRAAYLAGIARGDVDEDRGPIAGNFPEATEPLWMDADDKDWPRSPPIDVSISSLDGFNYEKYDASRRAAMDAEPKRLLGGPDLSRLPVSSIFESRLGNHGVEEDEPMSLSQSFLNMSIDKDIFIDESFGFSNPGSALNRALPEAAIVALTGNMEKIPADVDDELDALDVGASGDDFLSPLSMFLTEEALGPEADVVTIPRALGSPQHRSRHGSPQHRSRHGSRMSLPQHRARSLQGSPTRSPQHSLQRSPVRSSPQRSPQRSRQPSPTRSRQPSPTRSASSKLPTPVDVKQFDLSGAKQPAPAPPAHAQALSQQQQPAVEATGQPAAAKDGRRSEQQQQLYMDLMRRYAQPGAPAVAAAVKEGGAQAKSAGHSPTPTPVPGASASVGHSLTPTPVAGAGGAAADPSFMSYSESTQAAVNAAIHNAHQNLTGTDGMFAATPSTHELLRMYRTLKDQAFSDGEPLSPNRKAQFRTKMDSLMGDLRNPATFATALHNEDISLTSPHMTQAMQRVGVTPRMRNMHQVLAAQQMLQTQNHAGSQAQMTAQMTAASTPSPFRNRQRQPAPQRGVAGAPEVLDMSPAQNGSMEFMGSPNMVWPVNSSHSQS